MFSGFQSSAFQSRGFQIVRAIAKAALTGGHFLPKGAGRKRTLSNVNVIYKQAQSLPRQQTKQLRDAISDFVEPELAFQAAVPDIIKIDFSALESNKAAYEKFLLALDNIEALLEKQQTEDEELMLISILACQI